MPVDDYVELHDAQVERVSITAGRLEITFRHIAVYREEAPKHFGVWSHRAVLVAAGVRRLEITGCIRSDLDWVSRGRIESAGGIELVDVSSLINVVDGGIRLLFAESASRLECQAPSIALEIEKPGRRFESFEEE